ncbi:D-inositol-3-phosphate glycosyltransferase [Cupriavidus laharis]|uniref:D-inositol-3-phosphate glycosyltransferase n=1 Tax=Cupriavidus laharis TaxID=151654 RepID=A0ABN7YQ83_9BURK|nr:glycosyltransferase [Cupriavidus laharis]CAG9175568.1 D-inositol-3-phosphate glycosyltransferase [Cupriavidus laharis]
MRLVLDLQGAQSASRFRGIGRYSLALAAALAGRNAQHELIIALNGQMAESVEHIRASLDSVVPQESIRVWSGLHDVRFSLPESQQRRYAGEATREAFLASLKPDLVLVSSLFEGYVDDVVTSVGRLSNSLRNAVTIYDLVPLIHKGTYLTEPSISDWYYQKIGHARRADLWFAISESSRKEGIELLDLPPHRVANIRAAVDSCFRKIALSESDRERLAARFEITRPFVMYTGGTDGRKFLHGLIEAFASLPPTSRAAHQLLIVGKLTEGETAQLRNLAKANGLSRDEMVLAGYVTDDELVALYNACKAFVFPSWHEGFGLPALEAMACGAAVIGANSSSIPEVIGREDAMFPARDVRGMSVLLDRVLTDDGFRSALQEHGLSKSKEFSWDETARLLLDSVDAWHEESAGANCCNGAVVPLPEARRPRLAYVSPLPPEPTGIAGYSAALLPELSRHYEIDVICNQEKVQAPLISADCNIRTVDYFQAHAEEYDRIVYQFGNSLFHAHMPALLERYPGVTVLHDFFLSGLYSNMDSAGLARDIWQRQLYHSHGYLAAVEGTRPEGKVEAIYKYPVNLSVLQYSLGVVVHSDVSHRLASAWYGREIAEDWQHIPLLRKSANQANRSAARLRLGLSEDDFIVASFGMIAPTKLNHRELSAWLQSRLAADMTCRLVFVGEMHGGAYGAELLKVMEARGQGRVQVTGLTSDQDYEDWLASADIAIQLRTLSRGETSATALDCMNHALPTIVNAHGSMADIPTGTVWKLADEFADDELTEAIERLWEDSALRRQLGEKARELVWTEHSPRGVADRYVQAIERAYATDARGHLLDALACQGGDKAVDLHELAQTISTSLPLQAGARQLLVDVSAIIQHDLKTGIERVARSILSFLLRNPPPGFRVEPVYATAERSYYYARHFTMQFLGAAAALDDEPVQVDAQDVFLGLDWHAYFVPQQSKFFADLRRRGAQVYFVVHDLLPIRLPQHFPHGAASAHEIWLEEVARNDGALCVSQAVASELHEWVKASGVQRERPFRIGWFHNGSDIRASAPSMGIDDAIRSDLNLMRAAPTALMVGTVEPRKGHRQVLAAFDRLWTEGASLNLVIVGKEGWMIEKVAQQITGHPRYGRNLFWYRGISDEALEQIYATADGVIMASEGEGFGLPLVEAAEHDKPILARDIPVFREVAGDYATYFSDVSPAGLSSAIKGWLQNARMGLAARSAGMPRSSWAETASQIVSLLTNPADSHWTYSWTANKARTEDNFRKGNVA